MDMFLVGFPVRFLVDCCSHRRWPSVRVEHTAPRRYARYRNPSGLWAAGIDGTQEDTMRGNEWEHHPDHDEGSTQLGYRRWADLILPRRPVEETVAIPVVTPAMQFRGGDLRWDPRRR